MSKESTSAQLPGDAATGGAATVGTALSDDPRSALTVEMLAAAAGASAEDGIWLDVIRKMDEVYNDLLQYEVALEE